MIELTTPTSSNELWLKKRTFLLPKFFNSIVYDNWYYYSNKWWTHHSFVSIQPTVTGLLLSLLFCRMTPSDCVYRRNMELDFSFLFKWPALSTYSLSYRWKEGLAKKNKILFHFLSMDFDVFETFSLQPHIDFIVIIHTHFSTNIFQLKYSTIKPVFA